MKTWPFSSLSKPSHPLVDTSVEAVQRRLSDERDRIDHAQTSLLAVAAHELKSPLTRLQGYTSMLDQMTQGDDLELQRITAMVESIVNGTVQLRRAVEKTLDNMTLEADALELLKHPFPPRKLVWDVLESWRSQILTRGLAIEVLGIDDLPKINGDWQRLLEAFSCVIGNCVEHTVNGGRVIIQGQLHASTGDGVGLSAGHCVAFTFRDTSPGLEQQDGVSLLDQACQAVRRGAVIAGPSRRLATLEMVMACGVIKAHGGVLFLRTNGHDPQRCPGVLFGIHLPIA